MNRDVMSLRVLSRELSKMSMKDPVLASEHVVGFSAKRMAFLA